MNSYLRKATIEDMDLIFEWANDSLVRENSFSTSKITYEEHAKWYNNILLSEEQQQYIYMNDDVPIGQARVKIDYPSAEISYSIAPKYRALGYGKVLLQIVCEQVRKDFPDIKKIIGQVKPENVASQKAFLSAGFTEKCYVYEIMLNEQLPRFMENIETSISGGVMLVTNNDNALPLYDWLKEYCDVYLYSDILTLELVNQLEPSLILSYNYSHIIKKEIISYMQGNIINLHISFLPWNRGSDPNFWSFIDDTPKGVTIHQVEKSLDTGKILFQKELFFDTQKETFISTYEKLNDEIILLLKKHWGDIMNKNYMLKEQKGNGSYHVRKQLNKIKEKIKFDWSDNIDETVKKYNDLKAGD